MTTSVSSYRSGSPRFGNKDNGPINSEVKTYTLSPEELDKYQKGADKKVAGKGDLKEAKRLLSETDLSIKEIVERTGTNKLSVKTYAQQLRNNQKVAQTKVNTQLKDKPKSVIKSNDETNLLSEIKKLKEAREHDINNFKELSGKHMTVVEEFKQLTKNHEDLQFKFIALENERSDINTELKRLEKELESKNEEYMALAMEFKELQELNSEPVEDDFYQIEESSENEIKFLRDSNNFLHQENLTLRVRARTYREAMSEILKDNG